MHPLGEVMSIPYIATVWDLEHRTRPYFPEVSSTGFTWPEREKLYNDLLPRASIIITGTQAGKEEIVHYYRVNPANVVVDPFPVPSEALLEQTSEDIELKEKYGLIGDFLIYPAQFWPHKNHINLLRAFKILRDRENLDLRLVLTGSDKGNLDYVAKTIADLGLGDRVFLLGFIARADLIALYRGAVALVFPSFFGPDNLPPLEAFAIGCPVVAANVAGAQEQLGEAALLFDPSDPADMAAKIALVCRAPELRAKMICKGAEIARLRTPQAYIATLCAALDRFEAIRRCWVGV
jgi:glycosyltransferase involved in cell wall biosynthesis